MDNTAQVFSDDHVAKSNGTLAKIDWGLLIAQVVSVGLVYVLGSTIPAIPAIIQAATTGSAEAPELSNLAVWSSVVIGTALGLLVAWLWLRRDNAVAVAWNLSRPSIGWPRTIAWAAGATAIIFLIFGIGGAVVEALGWDAPDPSVVLDLVTENPQMFALWIVGVAWLAAGTGEELLYRGFLMDRLSRVSGLRNRMWLVLVIQAALFGLPHIYQGWGGVLVTGLVGFFFGWLRLRMKGNLWACILAHAAVDTLAMSLAYGEKLGMFSI